MHRSTVLALVVTMATTTLVQPSRQIIANPDPTLPLSAAVRADGLVYVSGTMAAGAGDIKAQTIQVLDRISTTLKSGARIVALRPSFDQAYASASVDAVAPSGRRVPLLRLRAPQPQWYRRYWLQEPIEIPAGSKLEVTAVPAPPDEFGIPAPKRYPLAVDIDFVGQ